MNWLLLITSSIIGAAVILYSLWPRMAHSKKTRAFVLSLVVTVLILPISLNYYFSENVEEETVAAMSFEFPDPGDLKWSGPLNASIKPDQNEMSMSSVTSRLEAKLKQNPNDISGWILLGRSYVALNQPARAVSIFEERINENPDNIDLLLSYGETLTEIGGGKVPDKAAEFFRKAIETEPANPRAGYDLAQYEIQTGNAELAAVRLNSLLKIAPTGAPWVAQVEERLRSIDGNNLNTNSMKQPTIEQVAEVNAMSTQDRSSFIRSMVDGLAVKLEENPDDLDGWLNLARSYGVLGEWKNSANAYQNALKISPNDDDIKALYEQAQSQARN